MDSMVILICLVICIVARAIIFNRSGIKWWKSLIPMYNKYLLGKMTGHKLLGIINAFWLPFMYAMSVFFMIMNIQLAAQYDPNFKILADGTFVMSQSVEVPDNVAHWVLAVNYIYIAIVALAVILWDMLMWQLIKYEDKNPWWIVMWTLCPAIAYTAFAFSSVWTVNGQTFKLEPVPVKKAVEEPVKKNNRRKKKRK